MRKYKASEIVDRALHLADLTNTDFLTHKEHIEYLNDAWKNVYQFLINKGDKRFVNEVMLSGSYGMTEFDLPEDLYQIQSLKEYNTNRLIRRKADSESDNSGTYEVFNNKLRVYGISTGHLVLTYYVNPIYITFPDKTINLDKLIKYVGATYKNTASYEEFNNDGVYHVVNLVNGTEIKWFDGDNPEQITDCGYTLNSKAYDWNDNVLLALGKDPHRSAYTNIPNVYIGEECVLDLSDTEIVDAPGTIYAYYKGKDNVNYVLYRVKNSYKFAYEDDMNNPIDIEGISAPLGITENGIVLNDGKVLTVTEEGKILMNDCPCRYFLGVIDYGYIYNDRVVSCYEDTVFNFPNDMYVSLFAYELALKYAMKQNASTENLTAQLQQAQALFSSSLNSDGAYKRISKVY